MLSVMGVSHHNQSSFICSSFFFKPKLDLQKTIGCLRHHRHPRPLFLEIKMAQSRHSRIPLLVCPFLSSCDLPEALAESSSCKGEFLQSRTFRGLEARAGLDPPSVLQQGRSGIARGYDDDHRA